MKDSHRSQEGRSKPVRSPKTKAREEARGAGAPPVAIAAGFVLSLLALALWAAFVG
ncbi:MAG: hypothetical protein KC731_20605 [Myxococcales bacterium]|nr:hypothetical protein [Myxococcales bacterium]